MGYYLGLDSSTQSLSAIVIDTDSGEVVLDESVNFGKDMAEYGCPNGFLPNDNPLIRHSDPMMWAAALEKLLSNADFDWSKIDAVSGSGQQHGSVYLKESFFDVIKLQSDAPIVDQLKPCLSRETAVIWMDSSTSDECNEIAEAAGGKETVGRISGSIPIERFTGPQIRKFYKQSPDAYGETARIHLVSSFMASIISGSDAPLDPGDGAGLNLMDLSTRDWSEKLLDATAPNLRQKLPRIELGGTRIGTVADYFVKKYGFRSDAAVVTWSGDNPCSLVGMGATEPGTAVISLGTSDTFFAAMSQPVTDPNGYGHVFGNPANGYMCLLCFKNGSLARETVMEKVGKPKEWQWFEDAIIDDTATANDGKMMLPYFEAETTPLILNPEPKLFGSESFVNWQEPSPALRAVVEAQAMTMRIHSRWISDTPTTIRITGGASRSDAHVQILADVFGARIERLKVTNSAGLGSALMAAKGSGDHEWGELFATFAKTSPNVFEPIAKNTAKYEEMMKEYQSKLSESYGV